MNDIVIAAIPPSLVPIIWPKVRDMIEVALDESNEELCLYSMKDRMKAGEMILITIAEKGEVICVFTLEVREFETGKKVLNLCTVGGEGFTRWWDDIEREFMKVAIENDCQEVYVVGRPGWQKLLCCRGFNVVHTTLSRKVGEL